MGIHASLIKQAYPDGMGEVAARKIISKTAVISDPTQALTSGALAIKAGGSAVVKTVAVVKALSGGNLMTKAVGDMAALSGTVTADKFNVFLFAMTAAGTLSTTMGTEGASLAAVRFPVVPVLSVVIGFVIINPTGTGNYIGGTDALDDGTIVPNAAYVNTPFFFDPAS